MTDYSLIGVNGNAFSIMGYVQRCMRNESYSQEEISEYIKDAQCSDYDHLLSVSIDMIHKVNAKRRSKIKGN